MSGDNYEVNHESEDEEYRSILGKSTRTRLLPLPVDESVGFDSLPDQAMSKSTERGFIFNILCVGKFLNRCLMLEIQKRPERENESKADQSNVGCWAWKIFN